MDERRVALVGGLNNSQHGVMAEETVKFGKLEDYSKFTDDFGYGNYYCSVIEERNVVLVGKMQCGKTGIIKSFINPRHAMSKGAHADTRAASKYVLSLFDCANQRTMVLNFVDTPGLYEIRKDTLEIRTNDVLKDLMITFMQNDLCYVNLLCFVIDIDRTTDDLDVKAWEELIALFGDLYSDVSLIVFTHCDRKSDSKRKELISDILEGDKTKFIASYCKKGYICMGALDKDDIECVADEEEFAIKMAKKRIQKNEKFRIGFMEKIFESRNGVHIQQVSFLFSFILLSLKKKTIGPRNYQ
jgi:GTP-binding protein EngB required for normal cell division